VNPVFRIYALCILAVLLGAGLILLIIDKLLKRDASKMWRTYRGWLLMVPAILLCLWLGRSATILGIGLLSCLGFKEFARATGLYEDWWYTIAVYLGIAGTSAAILVADPTTGQSGWYGLFMALPVYAIALFMVIPILRNRSKGQLQRVSLSIVGFVYFGWMFGHLGFLSNSVHFYGYILFLFFAVELNDVAAFTFGKLFGKHQFRSEISPNKTLEGAVGALCFSLTLPFLLQFSFPHFSTRDLLITGLIVGVGGQLGDLCISFMKRDIGVKDMGNAIPGHGGILDRIDSLIFVAPLFFHFTRFVHGI